MVFGVGCRFSTVVIIRLSQPSSAGADLGNIRKNPNEHIHKAYIEAAWYLKTFTTYPK